MKRFLIIAACLLLLLSCVAGCSNQPATEGEQNQQAAATKLVVGATAKPHAEIRKLSNMLAKDNIDLEIKVFTDYAVLNQPKRWTTRC